MRRLLVLHNAMREGPLGEELMPLFFTSPLAKRQRRSASAAAVGKVDVQAVAESIADCCAPSPRALEACHRAVQAVLDGETSTLDLEGLSLDELPHALLHLRVDAVLADTERLSEDEASLLRAYSLSSRSEENFIRNTSLFDKFLEYSGIRTYSTHPPRS